MKYLIMKSFHLLRFCCLVTYQPEQIASKIIIVMLYYKKSQVGLINVEAGR